MAQIYVVVVYFIMTTSLDGKDYISDFNCKIYLQLFYSTTVGSDEEDASPQFALNCLHEFFIKYQNEWDKNTATILEFGGGPVISYLISAVVFVKEITFAAYTEEERKEVQLWKDIKDGAHDWSPFFQYVVNKLEQTEKEDAWKEREELLRSRLKSIIPCDITQDRPLGDCEDKFDIIWTSLCLDAACNTYDQYKLAVKKLVAMLKPKGFLVMLEVEEETFYRVGQVKWKCLFLTLDEIQEALQEAGLMVVELKRDLAPPQQQEQPMVSDYKAFVFLAAKKLE